jgi:YD repeat-containing protein
MPPGCVRAEATDHASGVQEFTFDPDGNLLLRVEFDNHGQELARETLVWSPTAIETTRTGMLSSVQRGVLGPHGELVEWIGDRHARVRWDGTFAPAPKRFAFETYYHFVSDEPLLPLDTALRGVWPRMRAFVFTGTVVWHRDGAPDTDDTRATYDQGHQVEMSVHGRSGHPRVVTKTAWRDDEPIEQTATNGPNGDVHRTFSSERGHLTRIVGGPDVAFTYDDAGNLTRVHVESVADVEVSSCKR